MEQLDFHELIKDFCKAKNLPDVIMETLIKIQSDPIKLQDCVICLLSEYLYPKSQKLADDVDSMTPLTSASIVEATSKGLMSNKIFKSLDINWSIVLKSVIDSYDKKSFPMTQASLSQFLSAISFFNDNVNLIDKFISLAINSNDFDMITDLTILFNKLDSSEGSIDLFKCDSLSPCLQEDSVGELLSLDKSILYFKFIAMIEVKAIASIAMSSKSVTEINQIFERDIHEHMEYILFGSINLLRLDSKIKVILLNLIEKFLFKSLDGNSSNLKYTFKLFLDDKNTANELGKLLWKYYNQHEDSIDLVFGDLIVSGGSNNDSVIVSMLHNAKDFQEAFKIAIDFSQFGWKNFKNFINAQLKKNINSNSNTIIKFLENQASIEYENSQNADSNNTNNNNTNTTNTKKPPVKSLNLETVHYLLNSIQVDKLNNDLKTKYNDLLGLCLQAYPRLINFGQGFDEAILVNSSDNSFSIEVEKEMRMYFQKMYKSELEIKDIVHMLKKLKYSNDPHDQDVFACMIHSLLDEYRFYSEYPVDALATTSVLFGNTIVYKLVDGPALSIALRYILESAQQNPQSRMFKFAIQALYSFQRRLPEFKEFCSKLIEIPALTSQPDFYETCKNVLNGTMPIEYSQDDDDIKSSVYSIKATKLKLDVIQEMPHTELNDKILFNINNLSEKNLNNIINELNEKLEPRFFQWFANYLLTQRVKNELNNQHLYKEIVMGITNPLLHTAVLNTTIKQIILLTNKVFDSNISSTERLQLKNLGSWLGLISLSVDKPLIKSDIDLKILLLESYGRDTLDAILPFVCKILEQSKSSSIFTPSLPWMKFNLKFLKEIYQIEELKLKLKFEIEFLYNALKVNLVEMEPTTHLVNFNYEQFKQEKLMKYEKMIAFSKNLIEDSLKHQPLLAALQLQAQQQQQLQQLHQPQPGGENLVQLQQQQLLQQQQQRMLGQSPAPMNSAIPSLAGAVPPPPPHQAGSAASVAAGVAGLFDNLLGSTVFLTHQPLKRFLHLALTKAVKELLTPLISRTISFCLITTKSLILKDFAFESDELKLRKAYINTIRTFTEYMVTTGSDLLRENISNNLHMILSQAFNGQIDQAIVDDIPIAANDNLPLAINIIQRAAIERAIHEMDDQMVAAIALRRQFKSQQQQQQGPNDQPQIFCDTQNANKFAISLPEPLGLQVGGVTPRQFQFYEDIGKSRLQPPHQMSMPPQQQQQPPLQQPSQQHMGGMVPPQVGGPPPQMATNGQEQIVIFINQQLEALINLLRSEEAKTCSLNDATELSSVVKNILIEIFQGFSRITDNTVFMKYAQMTMNSLFSNNESGPILIESFVLILSKICDFSTYVAKNINSWLLNSNDERRFNAKVMKSILLEGIICLDDLTFYLTKYVEIKRDLKSIEFICELIEELIFENSIAMRNDFVEVFKAIEKSDDQLKELPCVKKLLTQLKCNDASQLPPKPLISQKLNDYFAYIFSEWVKLYNKDDLNMKLVFLNQFLKSGIMDSNERFMNFFICAFEVSSIGFIRYGDVSKRSDIDKYTPIDSLASMVIHLLIIQDDNDDNELRCDLLQKILTIFVLVFSNDHENNQGHFNERPYFRFVSSLLSEWQELRVNKFKNFVVSNDENGEEFNKLNNQFYMVVSDLLLVLQPSSFPGFTFAWICLISHRMYLPYMISNTGAESGDDSLSFKITTLLNCLLRFQSGYVMEEEEEGMPESVNIIYKGTLKIMLCILNDYPDYLSQWGLHLIVGVNLKLVQIRNIVLSGRPDYVEQLDPFKVTLEEEVFNDLVANNHLEEFENKLGNKLKKLLDNYVRIPSSSLIKQMMEFFEKDNDLINLSIDYIFTGMNNNDGFNMKKNCECQLLRGILEESTSLEMKYNVLNAIVDQLRYESYQTKWTIKFIEEELYNGDHWQLTLRVLLERLVCHKPTPFGVNAIAARMKDDILSLV